MSRAPVASTSRRQGGWLAPLALFALAAAVRLIVAAKVPFPTTEVSSYYVDVARNVVGGDGLVSDAAWSYGAGPLVVPKPAFDLWMPLASFIAAAGMVVGGPSFWSAQVASALLGALVAPLAWGVAGEAGERQALDPRRRGAVAFASGLLAAFLAPFVIPAAVPDSFTPFLVFGVLSALLVPRALGLAPSDPGRPDIRVGVALGVALGLAYLSRQEAVWFGLVVLSMVVARAWRQATGERARWAIGRLWPVVVGGLIVVTPWLVRNALAFGSPLSGGALENAVLRRNEDIFAFADRPSLADYLAQDLPTLLGNPLAAFVHDLTDVLVVPAFPVGLLGLLALVALRRAPAVREPTALQVLLLSGGLTFLATVLLFPVATRWGTFLHASGPLLVALLTLAMLGADAVLARISRARRWSRPNIIVAPIALLTVTVVLLALQASVVVGQSERLSARYRSVAAWLETAALEVGEPFPMTFISDHPMWLADATDRQAVVLPDEPPADLGRLADAFDTRWLVVLDERGRYPYALLEGDAAGCLAVAPRSLTADGRTAHLFILAGGCTS
jgi:hypothetical protein